MALSTKEKQTLYDVYNGLRSYIETYGYSPTLEELYQVVGSSNKVVDPALRFLSESGFIQKKTRRWRGLSILHIYCSCGHEIVPKNAVLREENERTYPRRLCLECYRNYWREWRSNNRTYLRKGYKRYNQSRKLKSVNIGVAY